MLGISYKKIKDFKFLTNNRCNPFFNEQLGIYFYLQLVIIKLLIPNETKILFKGAKKK